MPPISDAGWLKHAAGEHRGREFLRDRLALLKTCVYYLAAFTCFVLIGRTPAIRTSLRTFAGRFFKPAG